MRSIRRRRRWKSCFHTNACRDRRKRRREHENGEEKYGLRRAAKEKKNKNKTYRRMETAKTPADNFLGGFDDDVLLLLQYLLHWYIQSSFLPISRVSYFHYIIIITYLYYKIMWRYTRVRLPLTNDRGYTCACVFVIK